MGKSKYSDDQLIEKIIELQSTKAVANHFQVVPNSVSTRLKKLSDTGRISKINNKWVKIDTNDNPDTPEVNCSQRIPAPKAEGYRPERDPMEEMGNTQAKSMFIDTTPAEQGFRFLKDSEDDAIIRIDTLMSCMKESDSREIKEMFKALACKIFESSLK